MVFFIHILKILKHSIKDKDCLHNTLQQTSTHLNYIQSASTLRRAKKTNFFENDQINMRLVISDKTKKRNQNQSRGSVSKMPPKRYDEKNIKRLISCINDKIIKIIKKIKIIEIK